MKDMSDEKGEQFSLQWNNFHTNLSSGFHAFLQGQNLVDVTLAAGGKFIQAHKLVLSVCSSYFKDLFEVNPCKHPIVIMKDVGHKELEAILEFMYRGETNVCQDDLTEFLKTAEMLQVKGLADSESSEEHMPIPSKTVTTSLASQSVSDKPLPQAPKRERPVKALPQEVAPQSFKRVKHEPSSESPGASTHPPVSLPVVPDPIPQRLVNSSSKSEPQRTKEIEHVELTQPKMELVEIEDSDPEEVDNGDDFSFFGGESSQSFQDTSGAGSLPDFDNLSQYANMLQEDGQELMLENSLLPDYCRRGRPSSGVTPRLRGKSRAHFPERIPFTPASKEQPRKRCKVCLANNRRSESIYQCVLEFVESNRGKPHLVHNDFLYRLYHISGPIRRWRCISERVREVCEKRPR
ncbi:protein bric-a-brac 1-like isoform X3 [Bacillus rossius redtenbacheri]|uniref:protein bric-a-brac 1-like isoform X3 n=1 Tax=Bacillus rossius redtenbacheri TaxID=93214 RepID=UPI002FDE3236